MKKLEKQKDDEYNKIKQQLKEAQAENQENQEFKREKISLN